MGDVTFVDLTEVVEAAAAAAGGLSARDIVLLRFGYDQSFGTADLDAPLRELIGPVLECKSAMLSSEAAEHPRLVAQRLERYGRVVGPERVIGSADCGFGTFVGFGQVGARVAEMKLAALAQGAALVAV